MTTESGTLVNTILCSLVEAPRDVLADLHPVHPWVLSCVDHGDVGFTAAIYDWRRRTTMSTFSIDIDAPTGSASSPATATSAADDGSSVPGVSSNSSSSALPAPSATPAAASSSSAAATQSSSSSSPSLASSGSVSLTATTPSIQAAVASARVDSQKPAGALRLLKFYDAHVRAFKGFVECQAHGGLADDTRVRDLVDACGTLAVLVYEYRVVLLDYVTGGVTEVFFSDLRGVQVTALEVFSKLRLLAFGGVDGSIRLWDPERHEFAKMLVGGHRGSASVTRLFSFQREGMTWLVSAGSDGAVCLWNVTTGKLEKSVPKAHDGGVTDMTYHPLSGLLVTTGNDKCIVVWDLRGLQEIRRTPTGKKHYAVAQAFIHPQFPANALIFFKRDGQEIQATDFDHTDSRTLVSLNDIHAPSKKESKNHKLYGLVVHPMQPQLVLINSSKGTFLLKISIFRSPDCAAIRRSVTQGRAEILMHYEVGSKACSKYVTAKSSDPEVVNELKGPNTVMTFNRAGTYLLVQYPDLRQYQIFNTSSMMGWKIVEEGHFRGSIAVSTKHDRYAFVEAIFPQVEQPQSKGFFKKKEEKPAQPTFRFVIKEFSDSPKVVYELPAPPRPIHRVFGGQLLGVSWVPQDAKDINTFQFFKWDSLADSSRVGTLLPTPKAVFWDPTRPMAATLFRTSFAIYAIKLEDRDPVSLAFMHRVSVHSVLWDSSLIFVSTDDAVRCYWLHANDEPLTIASHAADNNAPDDETPFPVAARPIGALTLVANSDERLFALDCARQLRSFSLAAPLFKCFSSAAAKNLQQALKFAEMIHPRFHPFVALFLSRRGYYREVLQLSGMDAWWKLRSCASHKLLDEALPILQTVVRQLGDRLDSSKPPPRKPAASGQQDKLVVAAEAPCSVARVIDVASELAMLARTAGGQAASATGAGFLRAVVQLDPVRAFALLAIHHAAMGQKAELSSLAKEASAPQFANHSGIGQVQMFCLACAGDPSAAANVWKGLVSKQAVSF